MNTVPGWEGILDADETILWQGRPHPGFALEARAIPMAIFGLFFAGFALFWMILAAQAGGFIWAFGLIHFAIGAGLAGKALAWPTFLRRRSWYTLSNKRAFIATDLPVQGRRLRSWPIGADTVLTYADGDLASIGFAFEPLRGRRGMRMRAVGFERIAEGRMVYALMRGLQSDSRTAGLPGSPVR